MTDHPITPPPELVQQWIAEIWYEGTPVQVAQSDLHLADRAARWGADQELEAIIRLAGEPALPEKDRYFDGLTVASIMAARRPKPPSLKEQALEAAHIELDPEGRNGSLIIRALEALPDD